jgi:hypothetical protein
MIDPHRSTYGWLSGCTHVVDVTTDPLCRNDLVIQHLVETFLDHQTPKILWKN